MIQTVYVSWPISTCYLFKKSLSAAVSQHSIVWYSGSPRKDFMPESYVKAWMESEKCDFKVLQSFLSWKQDNCMCCDFKDSLCYHRRDDIQQCMAVSLVLVHLFLCSFNHDGKMKCPHTCMRGLPTELALKIISQWWNPQSIWSPLHPNTEFYYKPNYSWSWFKHSIVTLLWNGTVTF